MDFINENHINFNPHFSLKKAFFQKICFILTLVPILLSCATTGNRSGMSIQEAIEQSVEKMAVDIPAGTIIAVVAFESNYENLSDYIIGELNGAFVDRKVSVVTRRSLEYAQRELNFQMSGEVSDETAKSIGKFFGADMIIAGELRDIGRNYRYRIDAIHVEEGRHGSTVRFDVKNDRETQRMINTIANQPPITRTAGYEITEQTIPNSPLTFLERGILFAMRGEYEIATMDFTDALKLNENMVGAYILRGRALVASISNVYDVKENFSGIDSYNFKTEIPKEVIEKTSNQAIEDFTQALLLNSNNSIAYYERGRLYMLKYEIDQASADYTQAIRFDPNNASYYYFRGSLYYFYFEDDARSIADFTQAIRLDQNYVLAYFWRGTIYKIKGDYERGISDFTHYIRLLPNDSIGYEDRAWLYHLKGDYNNAIADYTRAIEFTTSTPYLN
jgi:tetratricopeptide (TPR) repeat protein